MANQISDEQLDMLLKQWKKKGSERSFKHILISSIAAGFVCGFFPRLDSIVFIAPMFCAIAFFTFLTSD